MCVKALTCCCCGETTRGKQWWNRDEGYGICLPCAQLWREKDGKEHLEMSCGLEGVHWGLGADRCHLCDKQLPYVRKESKGHSFEIIDVESITSLFGRLVHRDCWKRFIRDEGEAGE